MYVLPLGPKMKKKIPARISGTSTVRPCSPSLRVIFQAAKVPRGRILLLLVSVSFLAVRCQAQLATAQVTGLITDPTGAAVPNAQVEVTNVETGTYWQTTSNDSGYYTISLLPPGNYRLAVRMAGFKSINRSGVILDVAQLARIDFTLEVGGVTETVEITATAPLLESQSASLGQVVDTRTINDLPLNGRNYLQLAQLSPGVLEPSRGDRTAASGGFVANGVRAQLTNFNLDGADNNSRIVDIQNLSYAVIQPSVDAIREFKLETSNYSAEYGYSAGAVVNAAIKSGTNHVHGSVFEFLRNNHLDARDFFQKPNDPQALLQRNQFGGTLGAPVIRNKLFFFGSWERTSENRGLTLTTTLPTDALRKGNFAGEKPIFDPATTRANPNGTGFIRSPFAGNVIPADRIDPVSAKLLALLPQPNVLGKANNFVSGPAQRDRIHRFDSRGDVQFSSKDRGFGRYSFLTRSFLNPGPFPPPLIGATSQEQNLKTTRAHSAAVGETHIFSPSVVNEFRSGYSRIFDLRGEIVSGPFLGPQFGFRGIPEQSGVGGLPGISISAFTNLGERDFVPNGKIAEVLQFKDDVSWIRAKHSFKAGGQFEWVRSFFDISGAARGLFNFSSVFTQDPQNRAGTGNGFADFLLGIPSSASLSRSTIGDVRQNYAAAFLQDDWKITPKFTLNLGVRYDLWTPRFERHDQQGNFISGLNKVIYPNNRTPPGIPGSIITNIPDGVGDRTLVEKDTSNLAPRVGLAYQLTRHTVLRTGWGVFFSSPAFPGVGATPPGNPPFFLDASFPTDQITPNITFASGFPSDALEVRTIDPTTAVFRSFDPRFKLAYVHKWSFGLQQEVGKFLFEANYVGTKGTHLPLFFDINQPIAGPGPVPSRRPVRGFGSISFTTPMGNSAYHAIEAKIERRYANGFSLLISYTHSKVIDNGGEQLIGDLELRDAGNVKAERSLARFDMRNRLVISYLYELPFGSGKRFTISSPVLNALAGNWQINGITTVRNGQPFTPTLGFSTANTGNPRPDRTGDGSFPSSKRTLDNYFDKDAFRPATPFNFGNAGRNILIGPGAVNFDFSIFKRLPVSPLGDRGEVEFRTEFFNLLNHPQFGFPNPRVDISQGGSIRSLATRMREIQAGLKIVF